MPPKKSSQKQSSSKAKDASKDKADASEKRKRSATPPTSDSSLKRLLSFLVHEAPAKYGAGQDAKQPNLFDLMKVSPSYTPFQNLVAAAVMSKPFSSRLGVRTLLTIFPNDEHRNAVDLSTPAKMRDAGEDGRYEALNKAKTQHKDKTSLQLGRLADTVIENYAENVEDTSLEKMHAALDKNGSNLHAIIKDMYMFGDTAADIFQRRIQGDWKEAYPFADDRALKAAGYFGLPDAEAAVLASRVDELLPTESDEERRRQFATVVEALAAADLEHRYEDLVAEMEATESEMPAEKREKLD